MRLTFAQMSPFVADWRRLGLDDDDLRALELLILQHPESGRVIPGTGGLRKIRFAPPSWHRGKRGATRVCYAIFAAHGIAYLLAAYGKSEREDISPADRTHYRGVLRAILQVLKRTEMS